MIERDRVERAINLLEGQRGVLGDAVVDAALEPLRAKLAGLNNRLQAPGAVDMRPTPPFKGERREVTILFCDVKGSTAMAEHLDPEEWARIMQSAMQQLTEPVRRHDGTVAEIMGDGMLAFFGAPLAHEDDPRRAVLAGLEILKAAHAFGRELQRDLPNLDFNVRVGIHTGLVVVGGINREKPGEYLAFGDAVNMAARMEQTAQPGTLQISAETHRLVEQIFDSESLGRIQVKGKSEPVETYRVLRLKAAPAPLRGLEQHGLHSPLVGRAVELAAARESLERLLGGQGSILGIFGEAGIGKTRLMEELHRTSPGDQVLWSEGHSLAYGGPVPYRPFQEFLRELSGIGDQDLQEQAQAKVAGRMAELFPDSADEILPYVMAMLGLSIPDDYLERVKYLDSEMLRKQILLSCRRFFEQLARSRPTVLVFEDFQWIDESSMELLNHLLPLVDRVPLLIIVLSRPMWQTPTAQLGEIMEKKYAARYTALRLAPLSHDDSARLMLNLIQIEALPDGLSTDILSKAEGNPFFLEEILRALIDQGTLLRQAASGGWRAAAEADPVAIPDSVQSMILARVDRLDQEARNVLRVASVIGRSFLYRVLREVTEGKGDLDERLTELQTLELIEERKRVPDLKYAFRHSLAQETIYENILWNDRRMLHAEVADAIETLFAGRLEEYYSVLAHHYAEGEIWNKARAYLLKAADQAGRLAADSEALGYYREALAAYGRAFGDTRNAAERAALDRKMGEALFRRGEWSDALAFLHRALAYTGHRLPESGWQLHWALTLEIVQEIRRPVLSRLFPARASKQTAEEELRIYQALKVIAANNDPELSLMLGFRMLHASRRNSLPVALAKASAGLGIVFGEFLNIPWLARYYLRQAVILAEQLQRSDALGIPYTGLMTLEGMMGAEWDMALDYGRRSAEALRKIGDLGDYSVSIFISSTILIWQGELARALAQGREQAELGQDAADSQMAASGLWVQGFAERCLGQTETAMAHFKQVLELAESSGNVYLQVLAANELGHCYLQQGQWRLALDILEPNANYMAGHGFGRAPFPNAMLRNGLAAAYLLAAEQSSGLQERRAWLHKAGPACRAALRWSNSLRPGAPEALRIKGWHEWLKGNTNRARHYWQKSLAEAERLKMPYDAGLAHLEIGGRLSERAHLEEAEALFTKIGISKSAK